MLFASCTLSTKAFWLKNAVCRRIFFIAGPKALKLLKFASKRLPARIWPKRLQKDIFHCRPKGPQMAEICFQQAPGQDLAQKGRFPRVPEGDFNCRPKGPQMAEICFQRAPGQDLGQKGRFQMVPEKDFNSRPRALKLPKFASKGPLARIWPKTTVSQGSRKGILIAGPRALKWPKFASKGPPARIWPKRAVSQGSQKGILIAGPRAFRWLKFVPWGF